MIALTAMCVGGPARSQTQVKWPAYATFSRQFAQNQADSLMDLSARLRNSGSAEDRRLAQLARAAALFRRDDLAACARALDSLRLAIGPEQGLLFSVAQRIRSMVYTAVGDASRGLAEADIGLALPPLAGAADETIALMVVRAEALTSMDQLDGAMDQLVTAQALAEREEVPRGGCIVGIAMGNILYKQERYQEAREHYLAAFSVASVRGFNKAAENAMANLAGVMLMLGDHIGALHLYDSLLVSLGSRSPELRSRLMDQMGYAYLEQGQPSLAMQFCRRAIALADSIHDERASAEATTDLSYALWEAGEHEQAIGSIGLALDYARRSRNTDRERDLVWQLHDWHARSGRLDLSNRYLQVYAELTDSLSKLRYANALANAEVRFETERKEHRISEQDQALRVSSLENDRKAYQRNVSIGIAVVLVLVALLLWRGLRVRQRLAAKERELHRQKIDELMHEQEMKAINAMLAWQEKERDRVAKDLHDRLGSLLSAIKHQIGALEGRVEMVSTAQADQFGKVDRMIDDAVGEVRRISHDLIATTLARFGLSKALEDLCASVRISGHLDVELRLFGLEQRLERGVEIVVYRIIQELISNVLKHAEASELSVEVTRVTGRLSIMVSDDGKGFDANAPRAGLGLGNVHARASAIGATVRVDSTIRKGTTVSVECPIIE